MAYLVKNDLAIDDDGLTTETLQFDSIDYKSYDAAVQAISLDGGATDEGDAAGAKEIDLTADTASVTVYDDADGSGTRDDGESYVIFRNVPEQGAGTGNYDTFLAVGGNEGVVDGFNTDAVSQDVNNDGSSTTQGDLDDIDLAKTETFQLGQLNTVEIDGVLYYEIRYDLNEPNNQNDGEITLESFILYTNDDSTIVDIGDLRNDADTNIIFDMDDPDLDGDKSDSDIFLRLDENSNGSGTDDYSVLIPVDAFEGSSPSDTVYLYVEMGRQSPPEDLTEEGGFEEWRADLGASTIFGFKFEDLDGDGFYEPDEGDTAKEGVTLFLDTNGNGVLDNGELSDVTDSDGNYSFIGVPAGTYTLVEVLPEEGYDVSTGYDSRFENGNFAIDTFTVDGTTVEVPWIGNFLPAPDYTITKDAVIVDGDGDGNTDSVDSANDEIDYTITLTNTGNVGLAWDDISDPLLDDNGITPAELSGDVNTNGILDVGETWVYENTLDVTQEMIDDECDGDGNMLIENTVNSTFTFNGVDYDREASADVPVVCDPSIDIVKVVDTANYVDTDGDGLVDAGDVISYDITVENDGNLTLTNVVVNDPLVTVTELTATHTDGLDYNTGDLDHDNELDVGETWNYEGSYTITQADMDSVGDAEISDLGGDNNDGNIDNEADVVAQEPNGEDVTDEDDALQPLDFDPDYTITKDAVIVDGDGDGNTDSVDSANDEIDYTITLTNTGNVGLAWDDISDPLLDDNGITPAELSGDVNTNGILDVGETWVYENTLDVTQEMIDDECDGDGNMLIENTVNSTFTFNGVDYDREASADVPVVCDPSIDIVKVVDTANYVDTDGDGLVDAGDVISYDITVENDGNLTLTNVVVNDPLVTVTELTATHTDGLDYNTGDLDHDNELDVGETWNYEGSYTITQADMDSVGDAEISDLGGDNNDGNIDNEADVVAQEPNGEDVTDEDDALQPLDFDPDYTITKDAVIVDGDGDGNTDSVDSANDEIDYTITLTNTGNVGLAWDDISDPLLDDNGITPAELSGDVNTNGILDVGETWVYENTLDVTQEMIDDECDGDGNMLIENTVNSTFTFNGVDYDREASADVPVVCDPSIDIVKVVDTANYVDTDGDGLVDAGDVISYDITVENDGNLTLTNVVVNDPLVTVTELTATHTDGLDYNTGDLDHDNELDVGETWNYEGSYTITQADMDSVGDAEISDLGGDNNDGNIDNEADVVAQEPNGEDVTDEDDALQPLDFDPDYTITKDAVIVDGDGDGNTDSVDSANDEIDYTITLTNTGNVGLAWDDISDPLLDDNGITPAELSGDVNTNGILDVGETWVYENTLDVTQEMIDDECDGDGNMLIENTVNSTFTFNGVDYDREASADVPVVCDPSIDIVKVVDTANYVDTDGDGLVDAGDRHQL